MNRYKLTALVLTCLAAFVNAGTARGQSPTKATEATDSAKTDNPVQKTLLSIAIQPFFLLNNTGKIDLELQPTLSRSAYIFSAEVYSGRTRDGDTGYKQRNNPWDKIGGAGIGLSRKYWFRETRTGPYGAYGFTYRYQEITIETEGFYPYQEDGLNYYGYGPLKKSLAISSGLASAVFGLQKVEGDFLYDLYFGFGYKTQFKDTDFEGFREYNHYQYSYAYKGPLMLIGFKIGFQFR